MEELTYQSRRARRSVAVPVGCGAVLCTVLGVALWVACLVFAPDRRWVFGVIFPFDYVVSLFVYHASNGSPSVGETAGVIIWLLAPLQFAVYGGAMGFGMARGSWKRTFIILLCCHAAAAAVAYCMDVATLRP